MSGNAPGAKSRSPQRLGRAGARVLARLEEGWTLRLGRTGYFLRHPDGSSVTVDPRSVLALLEHRLVECDAQGVFQLTDIGLKLSRSSRAMRARVRYEE